MRQKDNAVAACMLIGFILVMSVVATNFYDFEGLTNINFSFNPDTHEYINTAKALAGYSYTPIPVVTAHSQFYTIFLSAALRIYPDILSARILNIIITAFIALATWLLAKEIRIKNKIMVIIFSLFTPILAYYSLFINPITAGTLVLVLYFVLFAKFLKSKNEKFLYLSGLFLGLSIAFKDYDFIVFFFAALIYFLIKKEFSFRSVSLFSIMVFAGTLPAGILDYFLFGIPYYTFFSRIFSFYAGVYPASAFGFTGIYFYFLPILIPLSLLAIYYVAKKKISTLEWFLALNILIPFLIWPFLTNGISIKHIYPTAPLFLVLGLKGFYTLKERNRKIVTVTYIAFSLIFLSSQIYQIYGEKSEMYFVKDSANKILEKYKPEIIFKSYDTSYLDAFVWSGSRVLQYDDFLVFIGEYKPWVFEKKLFQPKVFDISSDIKLKVIRDRERKTQTNNFLLVVTFPADAAVPKTHYNLTLAECFVSQNKFFSYTSEPYAKKICVYK